MTVAYARAPAPRSSVMDVLAEGGFDAVEAVAHRAGVTRPVVYDLFGDLEGLMLALIDREEITALAPLLEIVGGEPGDVDPEQFLGRGDPRLPARIQGQPANVEICPHAAPGKFL